MVEAQRALLDELMGTARDLTAEERKMHKEIKWDDREVCGCYLVKFCPHELFVNTKSDLGPCPKIHDPKLKESYDQSTRRDLYISRFEAELFQFCEKLVQDLDRKVRRGRERLAQDMDTSNLMPISTEKSDQLVNIEESIKKFLEETETFGEDGKVDEAESLMKKVDLLNIEKAILIQQMHNERGLILSQEKKMALCEICGSFLVANDATERTQSHMTGKQHIGYGLVREYVFDYQARKKKAWEDERAIRNQQQDTLGNYHDDDDKDKDKEKLLFINNKGEHKDERCRRVGQRYWDHERASPPQRISKRDYGQEQDHHYCSNHQDCNNHNHNHKIFSSKKHCNLDSNQPHRHHHKDTRPTTQFPSKTIITHTTLNRHPQRQSRSPDHRV